MFRMTQDGIIWLGCVFVVMVLCAVGVFILWATNFTKGLSKQSKEREDS